MGVVPGSLVSGAESVLLRDIIGARDAGWRVRVACSDGPFVDRLNLEGVERVAIPDLRLADGHRGLAFARAAVNAVRAAVALRRALHPGEVILANSINVLPATALVSRGHRVVYFGHDVLIRRDRVALLKLVRRSVHIAVAVSEAVARTIRTTGVPTTVIHNGTAWPWLMPMLAEAMLLAYGNAAELPARALLGTASRSGSVGSVGNWAEIMDGAAPHLPKGCPAQAWSASELLRLVRQVSEPGRQCL